MWWKWDLHVHTPASIANNQYGGNSDEAWDVFLSDLENLPEEFKVIGVNDYLFLDGYRRVLEEKQRGRLSNIDLILPVVELRLDKFGGTDGKLSRVNFHAIFSNKLNPDVIETQFIKTLEVEARLTPSATADRPTFSGVISRQAVEDFGRAIIESLPDSERQHFDSPLIEGFNSLNFSLDSVRKALTRTYFEKKVLTAVGKTEWWDIKWNAQSIADKKDIINGVDFVFISAEDPEHCGRAVKALTESGVNNRLLDCSDAHSLSTATIKDRIGNCCTWLCADTEFEGLRQVRKEPEGRIHLEGEPPQRRRLREAPRRFIKSVQIDCVTPSKGGHIWFDGVSLDLNPALVAVIGKKGSGKSALADTLGLLGLTSRMQHASFLNSDRFRSGGLAGEFKGTLTWYSGDPTEINLAKNPPDGSVAELNYIPQDFFEEVCNELIGHTKGQFNDELKKVIFSWIPRADRLEASNLDELINHHVEEVESGVHRRRGEVSKINAQIVSYLALLKPAAISELEKSLTLKLEALSAHLAQRPPEVARPEEDSGEKQSQLAELTRAVEEAEQKVADAKERQTEVVSLLSRARKVRRRMVNVVETVESFTDQSMEDLNVLGLKRDEILRIEVDYQPLDAVIDRAEEERRTLDQILKEDDESPGELIAHAAGAQHRLDEARDRLEGPYRAYEQYLEDLRQWQKRKDQIVGDPSQPDSLRGVAASCRRLKEIPQNLEILRQRRSELIREIHEGLQQVAETYRDVYRPVQAFIEQHPLVAEEFDLRFDVSIENARFQERFFARIHHGRMGSYMGRAEAEERFERFINKFDFNSTDDTLSFIDDILESLRTDMSRPDRPARQIEDQLIGGETVEDLLDFLCNLEYLAPRYRLRLGDKPIEQLSPGEKGALLLVFYLLVDKSDEPLVIDQPEGNLDNETVFSLLVPSIKLAKARRQIIMVTHNPNLAVVCDAEQIVVAHRKSYPSVRIDYRSGGIEDPNVRNVVVDILEGTKPAFLNREHKYLR